jgi:hypothetical protein
MDAYSQQIIDHYAQAYQQLYKRSPRELRMIGNGWVNVNGAKMRISELEFLTRQLQKEYYSLPDNTIQRRSIVNRLLNWFKQ